MRDARCTLKLALPNDDVCRSLHFISSGPYMGEDVLMLMDDLCGRVYVVRSTLDGKHLSVSEKVVMEKGMEVIKKMLDDQSNWDCSAVRGCGQWGCD
jgi:hypothetical protein